MTGKVTARSLPSLLDRLAEVPTGADPYVALWDDQGLRAVVALASGMALYSREPYAEGYDRVAVACPEGGRVWAVRPRGHPYWVLPGGHIDAGESPTTAAQREMREESGVAVSILADLGVLHRPWARTRVFLGKRVGAPGHPQTPDEVEGFGLVELADLDPSERVWLEPKLARYPAGMIEAWEPAEHPRQPGGAPAGKGGEFAPNAERQAAHDALVAKGWKPMKGGFAYQKGIGNDNLILVHPDGHWRRAELRHGDAEMEWDKYDVFGLFEDRPTVAKGPDAASLSAHLKNGRKREAEFDPAVHPRQPEGAPASKGGEFAPKGTNGSSGGTKAAKGETKPASGETKPRPDEPKAERGWYESFTVAEAIDRLTKKQKVAMRSTASVATLLDKLGERAAAGIEDTINLCDVTVPGTSLFCEDHLGIDRIKMPQLRTKNPVPGSKADKLERDERGSVDIADRFRDSIAAQGISVERMRVSPAGLRASQFNLDAAKVAGIMGRIERDETGGFTDITVSKDGYIIDGHHRWAAALGVAFKRGQPLSGSIAVTRIDLPVMDVLKRTADYANEWGIPNEPVFAKKKAAKEGRTLYDIFSSITMAPDEPRLTLREVVDALGNVHEPAGAPGSAGGQFAPKSGGSGGGAGGEEPATPMKVKQPEKWDVLGQQGSVLVAKHLAVGDTVMTTSGQLATVSKPPDPKLKFELTYVDGSKAFMWPTALSKIAYTSQKGDLKGKIGAPVALDEPEWEWQGNDPKMVAKIATKGATVKTKSGDVGTVLSAFNASKGEPIKVQFPDSPFGSDGVPVFPDHIVAVKSGEPDAPTAADVTVEELPDPEKHSATGITPVGGPIEEPDEWDVQAGNVKTFAKNLKGGDTVKFHTGSLGIATGPVGPSPTVVDAQTFPVKLEDGTVDEAYVGNVAAIAFQSTIPKLGDAPEGFETGTVTVKFTDKANHTVDALVMTGKGVAVHPAIDATGKPVFFEPGVIGWKVTHTTAGLSPTGGVFDSKDKAIDYAKQAVQIVDFNLKDGPAMVAAVPGLPTKLGGLYAKIQPDPPELEPEPEEEEPEDEDQDDDHEDDEDQDDEDEGEPFERPAIRDYPKTEAQLGDEAKVGIAAVEKIVPSLTRKIDKWSDLTKDEQELVYQRFASIVWTGNKDDARQAWKDKPEEDKTYMANLRLGGIGLPEHVRVIADGEDYDKSKEIARELSIARSAQVAQERGIKGVPTQWSDIPKDKQEEIRQEWINEVSSGKYGGTRTKDSAQALWNTMDDDEKFMKAGDMKVREIPAVPLTPLHIRQITAKVWGQWKSDSVSQLGKALQVAVSEEIGTHSRFSSVEHDNARMYADQQLRGQGGYDGLKAYVRGLWETSQWLQDKAGVSHLKLFRAVMMPKDEVFEQRVERPRDAGGSFLLLPDLPLTKNGAASFTADPEVANKWSGIEEHHKVMQRVVVKADVPATAVLALPVFGANVHEEKEVVVLGTPWRKWEAFRGMAPGEEILHTSEAKTPKPEPSADDYLWQEGAKKTAKPKVIIDLDGPHWLANQNPK